ncbi:transposase domain-containing protein [Streptomyces sp. NPDC001034]|uniref:transposase domain-containing protein n=1 Tax=Streptomyces sp. NPDC001034 TaxID=3154375 RepID=UPI003333490D
MTQVIDPQLVDAVVEETGSRERRVRLLPARVVVYFVLALAVFERSSYQAGWDKLGAGLHGIAVARPCASSLSRARRQLGSAPLRRLSEILAGPVAARAQSGIFYRGLRAVVMDGTTLCVPDEEAVTWCFPKYNGAVLEFGYPLLRLVALVECGTRALLGPARPSARTPPANSATHAACCLTWTPRWCCWPTPTTTHTTSWRP